MSFFKALVTLDGDSGRVTKVECWYRPGCWTSEVLHEAEGLLLGHTDGELAGAHFFRRPTLGAMGLFAGQPGAVRNFVAQLALWAWDDGEGAEPKQEEAARSDREKQGSQEGG